MRRNLNLDSLAKKKSLRSLHDLANSAKSSKSSLQSFEESFELKKQQDSQKQVQPIGSKFKEMRKDSKKNHKN
jgi:hypothetical protein